ncbi:MAG: M48 family metalloprotease [Candidatus Marinimicrobia bacterium]|nr:M48 family metalloprotease [Candidatus Neomarinimicrobiota bacterium]
MKKKVLFVIIVMLVMFSLLFATKVVNNNITMRSGKGSFYPVVSVLEKGTDVQIIEDGETWKKIKTTDEKTGFVSAQAFVQVQGTIDYGAMAKDISSRDASTTLVTAAVKGFFDNKLSDKSINRDIFQHPFKNYIKPNSYISFKNATFAGRWSANKFQRKYRISKPKPFVIDETLFATSCYIASLLTSDGVITDSRKLNYVNNVAQLIVESTEYYDLPICVHIADTDDLFVNALPIGVIVISNGLLNECRNESELACLLAHEISHITLQHGSIEKEKRRVKMRAEDAFSELDETFGTDTKEMDALADEMYARAIKGRLQKYEAEADRMGVIYAYRAGYDVRGLSKLMQRLESQMPRSHSIEDATHWFPYSFKNRIIELEKFIRLKLRIDDNYEKIEKRFNRNINYW